MPANRVKALKLLSFYSGKFVEKGKKLYPSDYILEDNIPLPGLHHPILNFDFLKGNTMTVMDVSPIIASQWLSTNKSNRAPKKLQIKEFARAMKNGEWVVNGQDILFDENNLLIDGQNRLMAVVQANCTIKMGVKWGIDRSTSNTIDIGTPRSFKDNLYMRGEANSEVLSPGLSWLFRYENNRMFVSQKIPRSTLAKLLDDNPAIRDAAQFVQDSKKTKDKSITRMIPQGIAVFLRHKIMLSDPTKGEEFFKSLCLGHNLQDGDPVYALREKLRDEATTQRTRDDVKTVVYTIKAWNYYKSGTKTPRLRYSQNEEIPQVM